MFGIGLPELMVVLVLALLIFGPAKLPELARSLGRGLAEFRRASNDLRSSLTSDPAPRQAPPQASADSTPPLSMPDRENGPTESQASSPESPDNTSSQSKPQA